MMSLSNRGAGLVLAATLAAWGCGDDQTIVGAMGGADATSDTGQGGVTDASRGRASDTKAGDDATLQDQVGQEVLIPSDVAQDDGVPSDVEPPVDAVADAESDDILPSDSGGCKVSADCPAVATACAQAVCQGDGTCAVVALPVGATCSDGLACTVGDACDPTGKCQGAVDPVACDYKAFGKDASCASLACQDGENGKTVCMFSDLTATCSDGSACTQEDTCKFGACLGIPVACDDNNPCTKDSCDPLTACIHVPVSAEIPCSDSDACTSGDLCAGGVCAPGEAIDCGDDNPCTSDLCDPKGGCGHVPGEGACSDGSACTAGDLCKGGACLPGVATECDDANPCTGDVCDPKTGCVFAPNTMGCDDGSACSQGDQCQGGACIAGKALECSDGNPCTDDSCDILGGCVHSANTGACSDGSVCTQADVCASGICQPGPSLPCDDENPCTTDSCDPMAGCQHSPASQACDDGDACTQGDQCQGSKCAPGKAISCDDGNACTDDVCDPKAGCSHGVNASACDDGNACSSGDQCSGGVCKPGKPPACDDGNPCTSENCDATQGCNSVPNSLPCSDGSVCTLGDQCQVGKCLPGKGIVCDDGNICTDDACDASAGCSHTANTASCDDGNACTSGDMCVNASCSGGVPVDCDDNNGCTADQCAPASGCQHKATTQPCDDGSACTKGDACAGGNCLPGKVIMCDDGNACTDDACDLSKGCTATANAAPCSDGNACTSGDVCSGGACSGVKPAVCDDGKTCTVDWCDPSKGCQTLAIPGTCDDGSACTNADTCTAGSCAGKAIVCDDADPCTTDSCDSKLGCATTAAPDGTICGGTGTCTAGKCSLGSQNNPAQSCLAVQTAAPTSKSGVYWLDPNATGAFQAYCDMDTEGGGWTSMVHLSPLAKLNYTVPHTQRAVSQGTQFWVLGPRAQAKYVPIAYNGRPATAIEATAASADLTGWEWNGVAWSNPGGCHVVQQLVLDQAESEAPRVYGNPSYNGGQAMPATVAAAAKKTASVLGVATVANYPSIHIGCVGWNVLKDPIVWVR